MPLANYDINQTLSISIKDFLTPDTIPFSELKAFLTNKTPVSHIQLLMTQSLTQTKIQDQAQIQATLERKAYDLQINEDDNEKKQEATLQANDQRLKDELTSELNQKIMDKLGLETKLNLVNLFIQTQTLNPPVTHQHPANSTPSTQHQHPDQNQHQHQNTNVHTHYNPHDEQRQLQQSIATLAKRIIAINQQIALIDDRNKERGIRRDKRENRLQARIDYLANKQGISGTLSPANQSILFGDIKREQQKLEDLCSSLIKKAEQQNYSIFLEQFEIYLKSTKRPFQEKDALQSILKLMNQHFAFEKDAALLQSRLSNINSTIEEDNRSLFRLTNKLQFLTKANPDLTLSNQVLERQNEELKKSLTSNTDSRTKLQLPLIILSLLSVLTSIPLILTLAGIIPIVIAPTLLFTLVAAPPAALLLATLGVGIAFITYAIKSYLNKSSLETNQGTILSNSHQMKDNNTESERLKTHDIPELKLKIEKNESVKSDLTKSIKNAQDSAALSLNQAKTTEATIKFDSGFFSTDGKVHQHPAANLTADVKPSTPQPF